MATVITVSDIIHEVKNVVVVGNSSDANYVTKNIVLEVVGNYLHTNHEHVFI